MKILVNKVKINYSVKGNGPPVLLLHGYPQTMLMWRKVIPELSKDYTVVSSDLRGYGDSEKPLSDNYHKTYSKREMAKDQITLMKKIGFNKFYAIGHDRGARVLHRAVLDYPSKIEKLVLIDIIPTPFIYKNLNKNVSESFFHWFFLTQKKPFPEKIIIQNKKLYVEGMLGRLGNIKDFADSQVVNTYIKKFTTKSIYASCEDYRAGASIDLVHHKNDKNKISCPTLILWGKNSLVGKNFRPLEIWKKYAKNVKGFSIKGGHYLPEESPNSVTEKILYFLK